MTCARLILAAVLLALTLPLHASQATAHIWVAEQVAEQVGEPLKTILANNMSWYKAGATGPDICLLTYLVEEAMSMHHPGVEAHYTSTGELIMNLFKLAQEYTDETERNQRTAFAAGWLTHYCTDIVIHGLINQMGGYFGAGGDYVIRHKRLEIAESEHVFLKVAYPDWYYINNFSVPEKLITNAFHETYPTNTTYTWPGLVFMADLHKSAVIMSQASQWMVQCHKTQSAVGVVFNIPLKGYPPTTVQYNQMLDPLKITAVELEEPDRAAGETEGKVKVTYTVDDFKLHKLFFYQWDRRIPLAIKDAVQYMNIWNANPTGLILPNMNLDTGGPEGSHFDAATAYPGEPEISRLLVSIDKFEDKDGQDMRPTNWAADGQWVPIPIITGTGGPDLPVELVEKHEGWSAYPAGTATFKFPYDATKPGPYTLSLRAGFAQYPQSKALWGWPGDPKGVVETKWEGPVGKKPDLSILFLVDTSGSMGGGKIAAAIAAVKSSVDQTNDGKTEWCLARYGSCNVTVVCRFTMDPKKLQAAADTLGSGGDTPLTYGRGKALSYLVAKGSGKQGRLIILCDGQDNCAEHGSMSEPEANANLRKMIQEVQNVGMTGAAGGSNP